MNRNELKVGDKVQLEKDTLGWFLVGSELTYLGHYSSPDTGKFSGPAREDGCGGFKVKKGEIMSAFAYYKDVSALKQTVTFEDTPVTSYHTTIKVTRKLTDPERQAIRKIVEG